MNHPYDVQTYLCLDLLFLFYLHYLHIICHYGCLLVVHVDSSAYTLAFVFFLFAYFTKCTVQIRLAKRDDHIWVQIEDHFIFGHPLIELQIKEYNAFTKEENIQTISLFNDQVYPSEHFAPGMINLTVQKIRCFDILHLFSLQERKKKIEIAFLQLPQEAHSSSHNALQTYIASKKKRRCMAR